MKKTVLLYNAIQTAYANPDNSPSFSLMALSAYLKQKGYEVELLLNSFSDSHLKRILEDCLAVGFSLYTGGTRDAFEMASRIKSLCPEIPLIWGGYHPTLEPEQCLENIYVDYVIRGQGEHALEELLNYFEDPARNRLEFIGGLSYKKNSEIFHNETRKSSNINDFPSFDYSLYGHVFENVSEATYIASRGCPFSCKFCCSSSFNRNNGMKFYQLTLDRVFSDLEFLISKYKLKKINFFDDNFFIDPKRIRKFIDGYKKRNFKFQWTAYGRCQFFANIEDELAKELKEIGLERVYFGVESGSQRILNMINKQMKVEDVLLALKKIDKHGILGDFTFINGFPNEKVADVFRSLGLRNRIKEISPKSSVRFFVFTPLPGTEMLETCVDFGYKKPEKIAEWQSYEYHSFSAPWLSRGYRSFVNSISWAAQFCEIDPKSGGNALSKFILNFLAKDAEFRFRHKIFFLSPEFGIINSLYRKKLLHG